MTKKKKQCTSCKQTLRITNFPELRSTRKDGTHHRDSMCEPCRKKQRIQYYQDNKESLKRSCRETGRKRSAWFIDLKSKLKCVICGYDKHPIALVFHHRDPSTKKGNVSELARLSIKVALEEIEKCDVLCANCHMILHYES